MVVFFFVLFLLCFLLVGIASALLSKNNADDYLLAGRDVPAWLTALSAVATNNSGFMFIGLIGLTYSLGLSAAWIMVGWIAGDYCAWRLVHRPFREHSERQASRSIPDFLAAGKDGRRSRLIAIVAGLVLIWFLGLYAAAQLKAGSKALHVIFHWDYHWGATIGAIIIAAYCLAGGLRASIWTDAAQSIVMIGSMSLLLTTAVLEAGGIDGLIGRLNAIDPGLLYWRPKHLQYGFLAYLASWVFAGIGVVGQPHIMARPMAIRSPALIPRARRIYFSWYVIFTIACVACGLACRAILPAADFDAELALPRLTAELLPAALVGLTLAGVFAATMSTADSQVLSCSAAVTNDLHPPAAKRFIWNKAATLGVAVVVYLIAVFGSDSVFQLVVDAWAALASALGPLLIVRTFRLPISSRAALAMIVVGLASALIWQSVDAAIQESIYTAMPGMLSGLLVFCGDWLWRRFRPLTT